MARIRLFHWNEGEAKLRLAALRKAGHTAVHASWSPELARKLRDSPPDAAVIDLSRLPMQGRDVGLQLRRWKATRGVALVFVEGEPEKVERVRSALPDAEFASWRGIRGALKRALARPPSDPVVPDSNLAGYSGTPLPKKLGIKDGTVVGLLGPPKGFERTLGALPEGATLRTGARGRCELLLWFPRDLADLEERIVRLAAREDARGLWICWPKKASGIATDLDANHVRRVGLANGLVDYKVAAIDATYTGLEFAGADGRGREGQSWNQG